MSWPVTLPAVTALAMFRCQSEPANKPKFKVPVTLPLTVKLASERLAAAWVALFLKWPIKPKFEVYWLSDKLPMVLPLVSSVLAT